MELKYSQYDDTENLLVGRTSGYEILAVRVLNPDGTIRCTEKFEDSRHANRAIREAKEFLANPYPDPEDGRKEPAPR